MVIDGARYWMPTLICSLVLMSISTPAAAQGSTDCQRPYSQPIMQFKVASGQPSPTRDGCWLFAGFIGRGTPPDDAGIAVVRRNGDALEEVRTIRLRMPRGPGGVPPFDTRLTNDEKILVVSHGELSFFDVERLKSGEGDPLLGRLGRPRIAGSFGVAITKDDRYVLASQIGTALVAIVDLQKARASRFDEHALVGFVRTAPQAIIPAVSPDGRYVFTTTAAVPDVVDGPRTCNGGKEMEGAIQVADIQRAIANAAEATVAFASPAGCRPTTIAISPDGARMSAAAGGVLLTPGSAAESSLVVFDTKPLGDGKPPALLGRVPVSPQAVGVVDLGPRIIVGFIPTEGKPSQPLVIDATKVASGKAAIIGAIPTTAMALRVAPDGRTLVGSQPGWTTLTVIDLERVKLSPVTAESKLESPQR